MKILHISTLTEGGAANAAIRLHESMLKLGLDSNFLSLRHSKSKIPNHQVYDGTIISNQIEYPILSFKNLLKEKFFSEYAKKREEFQILENKKLALETPQMIDGTLNFTLFSSPNSNYDLLSLSILKDVDIIHFHWVAGFLDYESFFSKNNLPILWTLHDENPYLGGFHYEDDSINNQKTHGLKENEFIFQKEKLLKNNKKVTIISPSNWVADKARKSKVFAGKRVKMIRNTLNPKVFQHRDKNFSRDLFELPKDKKIILVASHDLSIPRKGIKYVEALFNNFDSEDFLFVFAGSNLCFSNSNVISVGTISDEILMSCLYSAADYFLLPSLIDNLPNTLLESLFCGTPVIAFKIGDFEEIFEGNDFGVLVDIGNIDELIDVLNKIKNGELNFNSFTISEKANIFFSEKVVVKKYIKEYNYLLSLRD